MTLRALVLGLSAIAAAMAGMMHVPALAPALAQAPDRQAADRARIDAAKDMMVYSGAIKQFDEAMPLIFDQLSRTFMSVAPGKSREIREVFQQLVPRFMQRKGELLDQIAALYAAEFSLEELNAIVAFYKSPIGLKFAGVQPKIMRQSMAVGQRWGERLGSEIEREARQELRRRGIEM
jgi:hypothetical protein